MTTALPGRRSRLRELTDEYLELARRLQDSPARTWIAKLLDRLSPWLELGLLIGYDQAEGSDAGSPVVTGLGKIAGRPVVVVAGGSGPTSEVRQADSVAKILRAQEVAKRQRLPIIYRLEAGVLDSAEPGSVFPGGYGADRILYCASMMRRRLGIAQVSVIERAAAVMARHLAERSDLTIEAGVSGVTDGVDEVQRFIGELPSSRLPVFPSSRRPRTSTPLQADIDPYRVFPPDHRLPYDMHRILAGLVDGGELDEFQVGLAKELICGHGRIDGHPVAVIANQRGVIARKGGGPARIGGIIYPESARKTSYFIETASREGVPILFVQDVSGFMVGPEVEQAGIIRAGAELVEAMATARVPRLVLIVNHASGAGYYAMAAQGFDPDFSLTWPTGRIGAMEGESAIAAAFGTELDRAKREGRPIAAELQRRIAAMRQSYDRQLDARHAAARGHVDAIVTPEETRAMLAFLLEVVR